MRLNETLIGSSMIITGILYPVAAETTLPSAIINMFGLVGFDLFNISLIVCGLLLLIRQRNLPILIMPFYVFMIALVPITLQGLSYTALIFYSVMIIFPIYVHYRERITFRYLNARRLMIPFFALMSFVLFINPTPYNGGMELFYRAIAYWTLGLIDPITFYRVIYLTCGLLLFAIEIVDSLPQGRALTQVLTLPFLSHGITFGLITIELNNFALTPFLLLVVVLWWLLPQEYRYYG